MHPDDRARVLDHIEATREARGPYHVVYRIVRPDGEVRTLEASGKFVFDAAGVPRRLIGVCADVTDRTNASQRAEDLLRFLAEASTLLASSLDYEATLASLTRLAVPKLADWVSIDILERGALRRVAVAHVDPAKIELAWELWRTHPPKLDDPSGVAGVIRTGKPEIYREIPDELIDTAVADLEVRAIIRALGLVSSMCVPLLVRGTPMGAITFVSAESGRRFGDNDLALAEDLAGRAGVAMENARSYRQAEESLQRREDMLTLLSQDLKSPLATVINDSGIVLRSIPADVRVDRQKLENIQETAMRMQSFLHSFLDLVQVEQGPMALDLAQHDPTALLLEALEMNRAMIAQRGLAVMRDLAPRLTVKCDRRRVVQVLSRIVGYAASVTPARGRISITVGSHTQLTGGEQVIMGVSDGAALLRKDEVARVFDRTWRGHGDYVAGLSFAISKVIVEAHGGTMWASIDDAKNSFLMTLPRN
jgi:signal transduction histidine kinase